jgi:hypothetical protein
MRPLAGMSESLKERESQKILIIIVKSVAIFLASLLVIFLVMFTGDPRRATGLVHLRDQSIMFFVLGLMYLALGVFLRTSPLLK